MYGIHQYGIIEGGLGENKRVKQSLVQTPLNFADKQNKILTKTVRTIISFALPIFSLRFIYQNIVNRVTNNLSNLSRSNSANSAVERNDDWGDE